MTPLFSEFDNILNPVVSSRVRYRLPTSDYSVVTYDELPKEDKKLAFYLKEAFNCGEKDRNWFTEQKKRLRTLVYDLNPYLTEKGFRQCQRCGKSYPDEMLIDMQYGWMHRGMVTDAILSKGPICLRCFHEHYCIDAVSRQKLAENAFYCTDCGTLTDKNCMYLLRSFIPAGEVLGFYYHRFLKVEITEEDVERLAPYIGKPVCAECLYKQYLPIVERVGVHTVSDLDMAHVIARTVAEKTESTVGYEDGKYHDYLAKVGKSLYITNQDIFKATLGLISGIPEGEKGTDTDPFMESRHAFSFGRGIKTKYETLNTALQVEKIPDKVYNHVRKFLETIIKGAHKDIQEVESKKSEDPSFLKLGQKDLPEIGVFGMLYLENCDKLPNEEDILALKDKDALFDKYIPTLFADEAFRSTVWPAIKGKTYPNIKDLLNDGVVYYTVLLKVDKFSVDVDKEDKSIFIEIEVNVIPKIVKEDKRKRYVKEVLSKHIKEFDKNYFRKEENNTSD